MDNLNLLFLILVGGFVAAAAGYIGSFMVLKRMALVGDALSHVALPGMALAIAFGISPIAGALAALTIALIGVWYLEEKTEVHPETLVGVFFTAALALGVLITPEPDLLEALFGNIEKISLLEGYLAILISILVMLTLNFISSRLILGVVSEDLAKSMRISISKVNLLYLLLVGVVVALGVKFVGTLLMGALVIIPAASAKNVSKGINSYYLYSVIFGVLSAIFGVLTAHFLGISTGPAVVLVSIGIFAFTYFKVLARA